MTNLPDRDDVSWMEEAEDKGMDIVGQMLEIFEGPSGLTHVENSKVEKKTAAVGWPAGGRWRCDSR